LNNISPFWCNVEDISLILPLWPFLPLDYASVLFIQVSGSFLLLEPCEEEWLHLWACLPLYYPQDEQYATIWWSLDLFMHQTHAIPTIMKQIICQQ
jgi:hypothetical protein